MVTKRRNSRGTTGGSDKSAPGPSKAVLSKKGANSEVVFTLAPGDSVVVDNGCLKMLDTNLNLNVTTKDGFSSAFKRMFSGNMFVNVLTNNSGMPGSLTACAQLPGDLIEVPLKPGDEMMCSRSSVVAFTPNVRLESNVKLSGLLLSGIFFQRLRCTDGPGKAWVSGFGELSVTKLVAGQQVRVDHAYFVCCPTSFSYKVKTLTGNDSTSSKIKNFLLSNNARLAMEFTGPGEVITQARSVDPLIELVSTAAADKVEDRSSWW